MYDNDNDDDDDGQRTNFNKKKLTLAFGSGDLKKYTAKLYDDDDDGDDDDDLQGQIQVFWGVGFFSKSWDLRGPPQGPQWVQGNALVGSQGTRPSEAPEF